MREFLGINCQQIHGQQSTFHPQIKSNFLTQYYPTLKPSEPMTFIIIINVSKTGNYFNLKGFPFLNKSFYSQNILFINTGKKYGTKYNCVNVIMYKH